MMGRWREQGASMLSGGKSASRRARRAMLVGATLCLIAVIGISCDDDSSSSPAASPSAAASPAATASPATEASSTVWLCRPGLPDNPCESSLETTVVSADGTSSVESAGPAEKAPVDCFFVDPPCRGRHFV